MVNPMKMAKCIQELERIKGIRKGSAGKVSLESDNLTPKATVGYKIIYFIHHVQT